LVKGYSETHERGVKSFDLIFAVVQKNTNLLDTDISSLRNAALADEKGAALQAALSKWPSMSVSM
jgi:indolepyruvate ferredoxin oxidoreductase beta subunit